MCDGLLWSCNDLSKDGTHPSQPLDRSEVATELLDFLLESDFSTPWFRVPEPTRALLDPGSAATLLMLARSRQRCRAAPADAGERPPLRRGRPQMQPRDARGAE